MIILIFNIDDSVTDEDYDPGSSEKENCSFSFSDSNSSNVADVDEVDSDVQKGGNVDSSLWDNIVQNQMNFVLLPES